MQVTLTNQLFQKKKKICLHHVKKENDNFVEFLILKAGKSLAISFLIENRIYITNSY